MIENIFSICVSLYFMDFRNNNRWPEQFADFAEGVASLLGTRYTHFSLNFDGDGQLKKEKVYKTANKNNSNLKSVLANEELFNLYYYQSPSQDVIHDSGLVVFLDVGKTRLNFPCKQLYIEIVQDRLNVKQDLREVIDPLIEKSDVFIDIQYGLVTKMSSSKLPVMYFNDIYASTLSRGEILDLAIWQNQRKEYARKIRSVYWGNLLGKEHIKKIPDISQFMAHLQDILGGNNVRRLASGNLFFNLPKVDEKIDALDELLDKFGLVMRADGTENLPSLYYTAQ